MKINSLLIGINYKDSGSPLQYAVNDAHAMHRLCKANLNGHSELVVDQEATVPNIRVALENLKKECGSNDAAIIHFAGHGTKAPDPRLLTFGYTRNAPIEEHSLALQELKDWLDRFEGSFVLLFIDACYSGAYGTTRDPNYTARSVSIPYDDSQSAIFPLRDYFSGLGQGRIVVAASDENQQAIESSRIQHGVFTQCLIDALLGKAGVHNNLINVSDVYGYVCEEVFRKAQEIAAIEQTPVLYSVIRRNIMLPVFVQSVRRSLVNFPSEFAPLTVVVGDRREPDPKTPGDFFARSGSSADLRWILSLGLPSDTEIISDKVFVNSSRDYLIHRFGERNLLIVGSPAANHLARMANDTALFWFVTDTFTRQQTRQYMAKLLQMDQRSLHDFARDEHKKREMRLLINLLKKQGFADPTDDLLERGVVIPSNMDYGVVTLCRHPVTNRTDYVGILAAGANLPGTNHAIRLLSNTTEFRFRPFGGIFHVRIYEATDWLERIDKGTVEWSTEPYSVSDLKNGLVRISGDSQSLQRLQLDPNDIDDRRGLLEELEKD